jgi:hypothetical protein
MLVYPLKSIDANDAAACRQARSGSRTSGKGPEAIPALII